MKVIDICFNNGNGILANYSSDEEADDQFAALVDSMVNHKGEKFVVLGSDDTEAIVHPRPDELCFIKLTNVEASAQMSSEIETSYYLGQAPVKGGKN